MDIYGTNGQHIATVVNEWQNAGTHFVTWNASSFSTGVYICKITAGDFSETRKMTFVK